MHTQHRPPTIMPREERIEKLEYEAAQAKLALEEAKLEHWQLAERMEIQQQSTLQLGDGIGNAVGVLANVVGDLVKVVRSVQLRVDRIENDNANRDKEMEELKDTVRKANIKAEYDLNQGQTKSAMIADRPPIPMSSTATLGSSTPVSTETKMRAAARSNATAAKAIGQNKARRNATMAAKRGITSTKKANAMDVEHQVNRAAGSAKCSATDRDTQKPLFSSAPKPLFDSNTVPNYFGSVPSTPEGGGAAPETPKTPKSAKRRRY